MHRANFVDIRAYSYEAVRYWRNIILAHKQEMCDKLKTSVAEIAKHAYRETKVEEEKKEASIIFRRYPTERSVTNAKIIFRVETESAKFSAKLISTESLRKLHSFRDRERKRALSTLCV